MSRKLTAETGRGEKIHLSVDGDYIATTNKTFWYSLGHSSPCQVEEDQLQEILDRVQDNRMYEKAIRDEPIFDFSGIDGIGIDIPVLPDVNAKFKELGRLGFAVGYF